jgi:hypothetical protein
MAKPVHCKALAGAAYLSHYVFVVIGTLLVLPGAVLAIPGVALVVVGVYMHDVGVDWMLARQREKAGW